MVSAFLYSPSFVSTPVYLLRRPPKSLALPTPKNSGSTLSAPPQTSVQLHGGSPPAAPAQSLPTYCEEQLRPPVHKSQVQVTRRAQRIRALPRSSPWEPESLSPRSDVLKKLFCKSSKTCEDSAPSPSGITRRVKQGLWSSILLASQA